MRLLFVAFSLLGLAGCDFEDFGPSERYQTDFHYTYPLRSGGKLSLENFNGSVDITGWDRDTVDVSGVKYAATPELRDAIKIEIAPSGDTSLYIHTTRPFDHHGNMGARYVIKVPRKVELERIVSSNGAVKVSDVEGDSHLRTSNGSIRAIHMVGPLDAQTTNGPIDLENIKGGVTLRTSNGRVHAENVDGAFQANTTNGGITAHLPEKSAGDPVKVSTSNGSIELTLDSPMQSDLRATTTNGRITVHVPSGTAARIHAVTTNSSIETDFDVHRQGEAGKHHLDGTIGPGGPMLELSTSNGHIRILKM